MHFIELHFSHLKYLLLRIKNDASCEWKQIIEKVMQLCLNVCEIVNPIVKSDSPEGIFPKELLTSMMFMIKTSLSNQFL